MNQIYKKEASISIEPPYELVNTRHGLMLANANDFYIGRALIEYGEYGESENELLMQLFLRPGAIVEVGANIGSLSMPLARKAEEQNRALFCFEPQPFIFQNLCANFALNGIRNATAYPFACYDRNGLLYFDPVDYHKKGNFGAVELHDTYQPNRQVVLCYPLDDFFASSPVGLLKIDVEGAELKVLMGASQLIENSRPVIYVENDRADHSSELIAWFRSNNYKLWWHLPALYNKNNFRNREDNDYGDTVSVNMLCLPSEVAIPVEGLEEVLDDNWHPSRCEDIAADE